MATRSSNQPDTPIPSFTPGLGSPLGVTFRPAGIVPGPAVESTKAYAGSEDTAGANDGNNTISLVSAASSIGGDDPNPIEDENSLRLSASMTRLPVSLTVAVPVREFQVRKLLAMAPGIVIESQWGQGEDLPLSSGDVQLAWSEFEVVDTRLAVRVTRLA